MTAATSRWGGFRPGKAARWSFSKPASISSASNGLRSSTALSCRSSGRELHDAVASKRGLPIEIERDQIFERPLPSLRDLRLRSWRGFRHHHLLRRIHRDYLGQLHAEMRRAVELLLRQRSIIRNADCLPQIILDRSRSTISVAVAQLILQVPPQRACTRREPCNSSFLDLHRRRFGG